MANENENKVFCTFVTQQLSDSLGQYKEVHPPSSTTLNAAMVQGTCDDHIADFTFKEVDINSNNSGNHLVDAELDLEVTDDEKNCIGAGTRSTNPDHYRKDDGSCFIRKHFCARAELSDTTTDKNIRVAANLLKGWVDFTFAMDGTFTVTTTTDSFDPELGEAMAERSVGVKVSQGACGDTLCELGSVNACPDVEVNTVLDLCIEPTDSDVKITGLNTVIATANSIQTLIDGSGVENFVTEVSDLNTKAVTLSTLLVPSYYDEHEGESGDITLSGLAGISYTRRLLRTRDLLEDPEGPILFRAKISTKTKESTPMIAHAQEKEASDGRRMLALGISILAAAGVMAFI